MVSYLRRNNQADNIFISTSLVQQHHQRQRERQRQRHRSRINGIIIMTHTLYDKHKFLCHRMGLQLPQAPHYTLHMYMCVRIGVYTYTELPINANSVNLENLF